MIRTYEHPHEMAIIAYESQREGIHLKPGDWVRHSDRTGSKGMLIANTDDSLVVLWSIPPGPMTIIDPDDFKPRKSVMTRYGTSLVRHDYYGTIKIEDVK